jgi:tetratricopeptide (TPR) repeat protein
MLQNGWFQELADEHEAAQAAFSRVIAAAKPGTDDDPLLWARLGTGNIQRQRGDLSAALASYQTSLAIADRRAQIDPGNASWQRDLWVSYEMIGSVQVAQGDLAGALKSYRNSLALTERLAQSDPGNTGRQSDLAISHQAIGDVQIVQGDLAGARLHRSPWLDRRSLVACRPLELTVLAPPDHSRSPEHGTTH